MDSFEDIHRRHITGSLAMFDRMIFKGHLSHLFKPDAVRALVWAQGYPMARVASSTSRPTSAHHWKNVRRS